MNSNYWNVNIEPPYHFKLFWHVIRGYGITHMLCYGITHMLWAFPLIYGEAAYAHDMSEIYLKSQVWTVGLVGL
jgi:hypothetical protein